MKSGINTIARAVIALLFVALCAGFLTAVIPAATVAAAAGVQINTASNACPIAKNLEYTTFKGVSIRGRLEAVDPDGDAVTFEIRDIPKKGAVKSDGDGTFVYIPNEGKKGRDTFSYVAVDSAGSISFPATVTIKIDKQSTKITYADMKDDASCYSALLLAEKGILTGEKLGSEYFFRPGGAVSRGEFLAMSMALTGTQTLEGITRTGFSDDEFIPLWVKPYVSAALMSGFITGYRNDDGRLVFASEEPITFSEAAVILNNALKIGDVVSVLAPADDTVPVWASQAQSNLAAVSVMQPLGAAAYERCLTRAEAADLIASASAFLDSRDGQSSLLSWAKN